MGLTKEQLQDRAKKKLLDYIKEHGTPCNGKVVKYYWNTYPICAQDICTLSAVVDKKDNVIFCDYDVKKDSYRKEFSRNAADLKYTYLNRILESMMKDDSR